MEARVITAQIEPGKIDEAIGIYRDSVVPAVKEKQGFKGAFLLTDPNSDRGISVTLWETEADMKAGETSNYLREQIAKFATVLLGPPVVEHYDVSVQV
jgi:heme-degrading monooxygenase HmoA